MSNNKFINNKAINGGALYFKEKQTNNDNEKIINFKNNVFENNEAEEFGGAMYIDLNNNYIMNNDNNIICSNKAGIQGGGIYFVHLGKELFKPNKDKIEGNLAFSNENNYVTKPSLISLITPLDKQPINIITGDLFPLSFILKDEFNNTIEDITEYYSYLGIKVIIEEKTDILDTTNVNPIANFCSFINGILYIYS